MSGHRTRSLPPSAPVVEGRKLTPEYLAMTPLQKWETLTLHGLLGTDEPWIDDMRETLRATPSVLAESTSNDCLLVAEGWQPIETCNEQQWHHMNTMLANWVERGVCETYWDEDEEFDSRPAGWVSPRAGWRSPGDQCIPVNQHSVTHWQPKPAPPAVTDLSGVVVG